MMRRHRSVRTNALAVLLVGLICSAAVTTGCSAKDLAIRSLVLANQERAKRSVAPLYWDDEAAAKAEDWAARMAAQRTISHSVITDGIVTGWRVLGENVGAGTSVEAIHRAFMNSPRHRSVLLAGKYHRLGVGVAERDGDYYVAQVYRG